MSDSLNFVRRRIAAIEGRASVGAESESAFASTGHAGIDRVVGGGLGRGCMHELLAETDDAGSGAGFAAVLADRFGGPVLWLREDAAQRRSGRLHAAGLAEIGADPARLVLGVLPDAARVLQAAVDALRCPALGIAVIELHGDPRPLDLTASRRLALAAETSGVTALLLRVGGKAIPSAARTRWRVVAAPSVPLAANAPGLPAWDVELLRQRGGPGAGRWRVMWDRDSARLRDQIERTPPLPRAVVPLPADRPAGPVGTAELRRVG